MMSTQETCQDASSEHNIQKCFHAVHEIKMSQSNELHKLQSSAG